MCLALGACAHKPATPTDAKKTTGYWEGKAYVKDLSRGSINQVHWVAFAEWPGKLRMDVQGDFGVNIASITLSENKMQVALFQEKKFLSGNADEHSLTKYTKIAINPYWINNVLFDKSIDNKNWTCVQGADGLPVNCERLQDNFLIQWKDRKGELKRFVMKYKNQEIIFMVTDFKTKVQPKANPYQIAQPSGFEQINLN